MTLQSNHANNIKSIFFFAFLWLLLSCKPNRQNKDSYLNSNQVDSLVNGLYMINGIEDSVYITSMFVKPFDRRVSFLLSHYGESVYEAKMKALQRMSGLKPPHPIKHNVDTVNVMFFKRWAEQKGYLK